MSLEETERRRAARTGHASIRIEDVARLAGVSPMTVSRAFKADSSVSETTRAAILRAADEAKPVVVEGVHVVPGGVHPRVRERCVLVEALVVVDDPDLHRGHFSLRPGTRPAERYLASFDDIRRLQDHLWARARSEGVEIVDNENVDRALARLMELVLDAVREDVK
jgi:2-phosphoglycerate kinase